ncbi:type III secretion system protein [uncultured Cedecea sp.]|uniref:type III secretion system protein n=1 Tax=uncultured Cedecea sp. TaxID=988762 RepID=UPI00261657E2|nr:type III secretion system protein [uncultured Cedecea sp.]
MDAWRNGKQFISLLERKQDILKGNIARTENKIAAIKKEIKKHQQEQQYINQQIKSLTPSGRLTRADIYKGIRQQGALLIHLQIIIHKVTQLEDEQYKQQNILDSYRSAMQQLDKRYYKLTSYIKKQKNIYYRRCDNNVENEAQEVAVYDRKKI